MRRLVIWGVLNRSWARWASGGHGFVIWPVVCAGLMLPLGGLCTRTDSGSGLRAVIIGGGPDPANNQAAIESNVRYVARLLPAGTLRTLLFADGNASRASVYYDPETRELSLGERLLNLALSGDETDSADPSHYKKPELGAHLDGGARPAEIRRSLLALGGDVDGPPRPVLLYFTGHGSSNHEDPENNTYDLWGANEGLSVRDLAKEVAALPSGTPVVVVMVQCFSGSFANLLFEGGDPGAAPVDRDIVGFFATIESRVAAGCTSAINEAEYRDFTSYFFAALTGRDRLGRAVTGADYNRDGRVGMDEAYCYTVAHDESIDVPVCTSDVFLRRFVNLKDPEVFRTPYAQVRSWASPAQLAALDAMSSKLHLSGEDRLRVSYDNLFHSGKRREKGETAVLARFETLRGQDRQYLLRRWPNLRTADRRLLLAARGVAIATLNNEASDGRWKDLLKAYDVVGKAQDADEEHDIADSFLLRFIRLGKSVVLAHALRVSGEPALRARFARLTEAEGRTILPPVDRLPDTAVAVPGSTRPLGARELSPCPCEEREGRPGASLRSGCS